MQVEVERFFAEDVSALSRRFADLDARIDPEAEPRKDECLDQMTEAICRAHRACRRIEFSIGDDQELLEDVRRRYQDETASWLFRSWIGHRARTKPRGYPGDYELLTALYDQEPRTRGLGGYVDLYLLDMTLTRAIRGRWKSARRFLIEEAARRRGDVYVLNVACGPCREYLDGIEHANGSKIHVTCIDNDRQALEYVRAHVATVATGIPDINYAHYNALRMRSAKANIRKFGRCDVLYSVGLCDYIPDKHLVPMLQGWADSLNDGGVVYVAFKDAPRYDKTEYQWLLDWYFFQRTEEECRDLFRRAGFDMNCLEMTRDSTGVIMNFAGRVKRPALIRVGFPGEKRSREGRVATPVRGQGETQRRVP